MGYDTSFEGKFDFDKPLDNKTYFLLKGLSETRRVKRRVGPEYGTEGEFYVEGGGFMGQAHESNIIEYNWPPKTQPSLWCQWIPTEDRLHLEWDGGEKFSEYVEWLEYLLQKIIIPAGYVLNGTIKWDGEEQGDTGKIIVTNNLVTVKEGKIVYE